VLIAVRRRRLPRRPLSVTYGIAFHDGCDVLGCDPRFAWVCTDGNNAERSAFRGLARLGGRPPSGRPEFGAFSIPVARCPPEERGSWRMHAGRPGTRTVTAGAGQGMLTRPEHLGRSAASVRERPEHGDVPESSCCRTRPRQLL
jgi:hypothetical protein